MIEQTSPTCQNSHRYVKQIIKRILSIHEMNPRSSTQANYQLGDRIRIEPDGAIGTIRYIGDLGRDEELQPQHRGLWIGVEWDEESRGKHSGTFQGEN